MAVLWTAPRPAPDATHLHPSVPRLFAALDATGALRFIGEVERGAHCGCTCPVCQGPLIARQGGANEWHFAHEASQERPECASASMVLLRRLLIERLQARVRADGLPLPPYRQRVAIERALVHVHEEVHWDVQITDGLQWHAGAAAHEPVVTARLDSGTNLRLLVRMEEAGGADVPAAPPDCALLVFRCSVPLPPVLRDRRHTLRYLERHAELVWQQHPDTLGRVAAARERLEAQARQIYGNWLSVAAAAGGPATVSEARPPPMYYGAGSAVFPLVAPRHECAPEHAAMVSFTLYRLDPQQAWLLYLLERVGPADWRTAGDKFYALAPYPSRFDGWDTALPASVGVADVAAGFVRCKGFLAAVTYLSRRAVLTRSGRDPGLFIDA